jgi:DNA-directed RNA polymerase specialized sigma24 family protein
MERNLSDQQLVHRISQGDEAALDQVYLRYWSLTRKHVFDNGSTLRLSKDELEEEARNLHQEVMVALYRNVREGKVNQLERDDLKPYLRRVIHYMWLNQLRRVRRHPKVPLEEKHESAPGGYEEPADLLEPPVDYDARLQQVLG